MLAVDKCFFHFPDLNFTLLVRKFDNRIQIFIMLWSVSVLTDSFPCFLQEVYDWIGSKKELPVYFTLHHSGRMVAHDEQVQRNETLDSERVGAYQNCTGK